jgi:L-lactate dehydrogenase
MFGEYFNVDSQSVDGYIIGEHGDSELAAWSTTNMGGKLILDIVKSNCKYKPEDLDQIYVNIRDAAYYIINSKGATYYGIGMGLARLTKAILKNENVVLLVSAYLTVEFGVNDIYARVPAIINR